MAELTLTINGRNFSISCDDGQEQRVIDLAHFVDSRLKDVSAAGAANNESHLFVLTSLMLADEVFDLREKVNQMGGQPQDAGQLKEDELAIAQAIGQLADRIDGIADRMKKAS